MGTPSTLEEHGGSKMDDEFLLETLPEFEEFWQLRDELGRIKSLQTLTKADIDNKFEAVADFSPKFCDLLIRMDARCKRITSMTIDEFLRRPRARTDKVDASSSSSLKDTTTRDTDQTYEMLKTDNEATNEKTARRFRAERDEVEEAFGKQEVKEPGRAEPEAEAKAAPEGQDQYEQ